MKYAEKLRNPQWQKKRLEIMNRDKWTCQSCGDTTTMLNVHHKTYRRGAEPWDYPDWNFVTLCAPCHEIETVDRRTLLEDVVENLKRGFIIRDLHAVNAVIVALCFDRENSSPGEFADTAAALVELIPLRGRFTEEVRQRILEPVREWKP